MAVIYDVGMHNGDDTAYYLRKGHKVVAIEANPALCDVARRRFADRLGDDLEILNVGVAKEPGELEFFIHRRNSALSTFVPPRDAANAELWERLPVPTARLSDIVRERGEPHFVKIDIEHLDAVALDDLRNAGIVPAAISVEAHSFDVLVALFRMGYAKFKLINCGRVHRRYGMQMIRLGDGTMSEHRFPPRSSGPFGEDLPGDWLSASKIAYLYFGRHVMLDPGWFDIHSAL